MKKVIVYIDGFNLYFGLKEKKWKRFYWLNLRLLSEKLLKPDQKLLWIKYFTSRISLPPDKVKRQGAFIEAIETLQDLTVFYGKYQSNEVVCNKCKHIMLKPNEKMTDVNIAVEMLSDAYNNKFDTAILISADSDLCAPVRAIREKFPDKGIIIAFPPERFSFELTKVATGYFTIGRKKLAESIFSEIVTKSDGYELKMPERWK
jgi:hypothetical protein